MGLLRKSISVPGSPTAAIPFSSLLAALQHNLPFTLEVIGDSTGDDVFTGFNPEWPIKLMQKIIAKYPNYNLLYMKWDDINQKMGPMQILQQAAEGLGYMNMNSGALISNQAGVTGDLELQAMIRPVTWKPTGEQVVQARWASTNGYQKCYEFSILPNGCLNFRWSPDNGTTVNVAASSVPVPFTDGQDGYIRLQFDADNGASGNTVTFYTSTDGQNWTQLGSPVVTAGVSTINAGGSTYNQVGSDGGWSPANFFIGRIYWVRVLNGIGGGATDLVPPLLTDYEQTSSFGNSDPPTGNTFVLGGAPNILLVNGSQWGQNLTYFNNTTRRGIETPRLGQKLYIISTGHNDGGMTASFIGQLSSFVTWVKGQLPGVPILCLTQNPVDPSSMGVGQALVRSTRSAAMMTWVTSQQGVYGLDTYPAFTDLTTQLQSDGLHPTDAGEDAWAQYILNSIL